MAIQYRDPQEVDRTKMPPSRMKHTESRTRGDFPELLGALEASEVLGVAQPNLRTLPGLPQPVAVLRCGSIWLGKEIRAFAAERSARNAAKGRGENHVVSRTGSDVDVPDAAGTVRPFCQ